VQGGDGGTVISYQPPDPVTASSGFATVDGAGANPAATDNISDFDFDHIASSQLAVDGKV
jgi:hypothetical protein